MVIGKLESKTLHLAPLLVKQTQALFLRWYINSGYVHGRWEHRSSKVLLGLLCSIQTDAEEDSDEQ